MVAVVALLLFQAIQPAAPDDKRLVLAARIAEEFQRRVQVLNAPLARNYIEKIAATMLAAHMERPSLQIVAFAGSSSAARIMVLPGGRLFVPSTLFADEATVRAAVAHAVAHVLWDKSGPWTDTDRLLVLSNEGRLCMTSTDFIPPKSRSGQQRVEKTVEALAGTLPQASPVPGKDQFEAARAELTGLGSLLSKRQNPSLYRAGER